MLIAPSKSPYGMPLKTWVSLIILILAPPVCDIFDIDDQYFHNVLWFFYLIVTIIIVFKKGTLHGVIVTAVESIIFLYIESLDSNGIGSLEYITLTELIIVNIIIAFTLGTLFKQKNEQNIELKETKNILESIFNNLDIAIWSDDLKEKLLLSKGLEKIYGQKRTESQGNDFWKDAIHPEDSYIIEKIYQKLNNVEEYELEYRILRPDGEVRWIKDRGLPVLDENGGLLRFDGTIVDVTEQKQAQADLEHLAYHDALTGLLNMNYLNQLAAKEFNESRSAGIPVCLMYFNLDRFKLINDSYGHRTGDQLLKVISTRLANTIKNVGTAIRAGGDDFIMYLPNTNHSQAGDFAKRLLNVFSEPFHFDGQEIRIAASIGITITNQNDSLEDLVQKASAALHFAKEYGRNQHRFYSDEFGIIANRRLQLEQGIRKALEQGKIELYYQPKLDLLTNQITGMEALTRWNDPILGTVSPSEFIPIAEEAGLIVQMGKWALEAACKQTRNWQNDGIHHLHVCVNISSRQFLQDDFVCMIEQILRETELDPEYLNLEITEGIALYSIEDAIYKLGELKKLGVSISLDDFGTGYSSLSYIKSLPIDFLKIDRAFIIGVVENKQDAEIIRSVISLSHSLGFKVVAEGVEDEDQLDALKRMDCDEIQGYYFAKPMPAGEFNQFIGNSLEAKGC